MGNILPPGRVYADNKEALWLNQLRDYCMSLSPVAGPGVLIDHTTRGTSFRIPPKGPSEGGSRVKQFVLKRVKGDYLECLPYTTGLPVPSSDEENPTFVKVMKPPELQKSLFNGNTYENWLYDVIDVTPSGESFVFEGIRRHATNGKKKEIQQVVPHYRLDWALYAVDNVDGLTGEITWIDLNVDGRAFSNTLFRVPEDGTFGAPDE